MRKMKQTIIIAILVIAMVGTMFMQSTNVYAGMISPEEMEYTPTVFTTITTQTTKVRVYVYEDTTLKVKSKSGTVFKKTYKNEGKKTIIIPEQKAGTKLTFYVANKKGRGGYVTKIVKDVTAPEKPKIVMEENSAYIIVKGEVGTDVYVKQVSTHEKSGWRKLGTMHSKKEGFFLSVNGYHSAYAGDYYSIRLVDDAGNKSEVVNTGKVTEDISWEIMY